MKLSQNAKNLMNEANQMAIQYGHAQTTIQSLARALACMPLVKRAFMEKDYEDYWNLLRKEADDDMNIPPKVDAQVDKCWQVTGIPRKITTSDELSAFFNHLEKNLPALPSPTKEFECRLYHVVISLIFAASNCFNTIARYALSTHDTFVDDIVSNLIQFEYEELGLQNTPKMMFDASPLTGKKRKPPKMPDMESKPFDQEEPRRPANKEDWDRDIFGDSRRDNERNSRTKVPKYLTDVVAEVKKDDKPFVGRAKEIEELIHCLNRKDKPNPILVGEPGVGKSDIFRGLARMIANDDITPTLQNVRMYRMDLAGMVAGARFRGDFEERLKEALEYLEKSEARPIVFIDETHTVIGTGSAEGAMDASNILKPYLVEGKIRFVGATTANEYRKFIEKDSAFMRRWQKIPVSEPSESEAIAIIKGSKSAYEKFHGVKIPSAVCEAAVKLSVKHMHDRFLPDKAIDILDQTCARIKVQEGNKLLVDDIAETISRLCNIPKQTMEKSELEKVRGLDSKLSAQVFGQSEAIAKVTEAIQMAKIGLNDETKPIGNFLFVGPSGVGKTEIAKQLAATLGIDFLRFDMSEYMESHSAAKLIGSPAGYVGYEDGGILIEKVRNHPHSVLLFDEIEKAHPSVFDIFLQMLDFGIVTDNRGRKADFRNTIIIMTSNAGNTSTTPKVGFNRSNQNCRETSLAALSNMMRPELLGRISEENVIQFNHLDENVAQKIARKELKRLTARMKTMGYKVTYSTEAINQLVKLGVSDKYGARELQKAIDNNVKRMLTRKILENSMPACCLVVYNDGKFDIEEYQVVDVPEAMTVIEANP